MTNTPAPPTPSGPPGPRAPGPRRLPAAIRPAVIALLALGLLHGVAVWVGMGGREGITGAWPLANHDHPLYFHSALVTRHFLRQSGTTAGYDPSFMAGYAKSVVFPASSTLPELVVALFGGHRPVLAYKLYVLIAAAGVPWLVLAAGRAWRLSGAGLVAALGLFLTYVWTDFPIEYATFGMLPYFLAVPLALVATAAVTNYLTCGGRGRWLGAAGLCSLTVLVHLTSAMVVVPAAALAYLVAWRRSRRGGLPFPISRHLGVWLVPVVVLALNAFWWWPGVLLASTKGDSSFAFTHTDEAVLGRLAKILTTEPISQAVLWALGLPGLVILARRDAVAAAGLGGLAMAGGFWGYAAGAFEGLAFLQPGRHTYVLYTSLAVAAGAGLAAALEALRAARPRLDRWAVAALAVVGLRVFGPPLAASMAGHLGDPLPGLTRALAPELAAAWPRAGRPEPFLSSRPAPRLRWVVGRVRRHLEPGQRLLYEESGFDLPGVPDPFAGGRYSGLLPALTGVEVLGGPYLHAALRTNFTQFGEGKLFGMADWGRAEFERYARLYRPAAILCWSPRARAFCRANPDLVEVLEDDGTLLFGRVRGFPGATIRGAAEVRAEPGQLHVSGLRPAELDGRVVLRYHFVPCLRGRPAAGLVPVRLEDDPVPFIGMEPMVGATTLSLDLLP